MPDLQRHREKSENYVWDVGTLSWVAMTQPATVAVSGTASRTSVADTASDTLLLASSATRKGASITNTSSAILYIGLGTSTVSATDHTAPVLQFGYYEVPYGFTGQIRGIWASDPGDGGAVITAFSA
jgi:hypothetical protein